MMSDEKDDVKEELQGYKAKITPTIKSDAYKEPGSGLRGDGAV